MNISSRIETRTSRVTLGLVAVLLAIAAAAGLALGLGKLSADEPDRQAEVAERGASVMPFDLDLTLHDFQPLDDGGLQVVTARNPSDSAQIALIREHLRMEAERFQSGDYSDPTQIHGDDMPGVVALQAGAARITVRYSERTDGAAISYTTADPALVAAIHDWFRAQTSDHGADAVHH